MGTEAATGKLRLGVIANNPNFPGGWQQTIAKVRIADQLGYDSVWLGETWGYDLVARMTELVITDRADQGRRGHLQRLLALARRDRLDDGDAR